MVESNVEEISAAASTGITAVGIAALAITIVTSSAATFISFLGFSEFLAFLPIVNLKYTMPLKVFFRGISGLNFQMLDVAEYLTFLDLPKTGDRIVSDNYFDAGFDNSSFFLNTADLTFIILTSFLNFLIFKTLLKILPKNSKFREKIEKQLESFGGQIQFQFLLMSYMIMLLSSLINLQVLNSESLTEMI